LTPFEDGEPCDDEPNDDQSDAAGSESGDESEDCNDQKEDRNEQKDDQDEDRCKSQITITGTKCFVLSWCNLLIIFARYDHACIPGTKTKLHIAVAFQKFICQDCEFFALLCKAFMQLNGSFCCMPTHILLRFWIG
jgi:hypothetical protein